MTPRQFRQARRKLGLSLDQMAEMLGYEGEYTNRKKQVHQLETGERPIREPQRRLVEAYLSGYRPKDWGQTSCASSEDTDYIVDEWNLRRVR
jgi:transcriptional regulator with XRE-family HTH domain